MSHYTSDTTSPPLLVSTLGVHLKPQSQKEIDTITVKAGEVARQFCQAISPGGGYQQSFNPPLEVLFDTKLSVSVHYRKTFRGTVAFSLDPRDILRGALEEDGRQLYRKIERKVEVVIGIQPLPSIVSEVVASCSRFRLLIIGESGVGKSSLIRKVFDVAGVDVSDTTRGQASIDQEFIASDNDRFVVHDSCGFEPADQENLNAARKFISNRRRMRDLKDQLHAIWLCLTIPYAGGRFLEAGVEEFLKNRKEILGNIPLVVVLTKLDYLVNRLEAEALEEGEPLDETTLRAPTSESLEKFCLAPLRATAGSDSIPHVAVSIMEGHEESLSTLVDVTTKNIQKYIKDEAAHYMAAIAQRVNISLKVELTIAVGEKRYWKALMASSDFRGHTMKACLHVIHKDIITVWNFKDPDNTLDKDDFKAGLLHTPDLRVREIQNLQQTLLIPVLSNARQSSITLIAALVTIIASVAGTAGTALPIVVPVAGIAVLGKLAHDLYKASQDVVRQLMAYIVDLTCVMQIVFLLASTRNGVVDVQVVGIAMEAYERVHRRDVHADISDFSVHLAVTPGKRDLVLDKIKELIRGYSIGDDQLPVLRRQLQNSAPRVQGGV
ncbi:hypothetical protein J3R82DRAFT_6160 [Butyriboletus roseoflavus]|nr:hypothetical protein J3R82DRAFT_6160 [Butyriboletus roseoflavus]